MRTPIWFERAPEGVGGAEDAIGHNVTLERPGSFAGKEGGSAVDGAHAELVVALAGGRGEGLGEPLEVILGELDLERAEVLLEVGGALGPRDRDDVLAAARTQARASWAGGDAALGGDSSTTPTSPRLRSRFPAWKRGELRR